MIGVMNTVMSKAPRIRKHATEVVSPTPQTPQLEPEILNLKFQTFNNKL